MAETTTKLLKLGFTTENNKTISVNVYNPASTLDETIIKSAMDKMIESGVVSIKSGALKSIKYADLVTTTVSDVSLS